MKKTKDERPHVVCHMMQTLDGKIASGVPGKEVLMDYFDVYTQTEEKIDASQAFMFGRVTASAFAQPFFEITPSGKSQDADNYIGDDEATSFAIVVDMKGVLRWDNNFIEMSNWDKKFHLVTLVTRQTPKDYLAYLVEKKISYVVSGNNELDLETAMSKLRGTFKIEKILLEGGGSFNGSMLEADLVDEISLLLLPRVLNKKDAPSLFDRDSVSIVPKNFKISSLTRLERDVVWIRYHRA